MDQTKSVANHHFDLHVSPGPVPKKRTEANNKEKTAPVVSQPGNQTAQAEEKKRRKAQKRREQKLKKKARLNPPEEVSMSEKQGKEEDANEKEVQFSAEEEKKEEVYQAGHEEVKKNKHKPQYPLWPHLIVNVCDRLFMP